MVFASPIFLFFFLPITLIIYWLVRPRNAVLLIFSLVFYAWGEPIYVLLMIFSIIVNWLLSLRLRGRKSLLVLAIVLNIGLLAVFKYWDFLAEAINGALLLNLPLSDLALPLGISFYTFQILSYMIDVYRGEVPPASEPLSFGTYVAMFPQLIAGPIVRYQDIAEQLKERFVTLSNVGEGGRRLCIGLAKKVLLANTLSETADIAFQIGGGGVDCGRGLARRVMLCHANLLRFLRLL